MPQVRGELDGSVMTEICTIQNRILKIFLKPLLRKTSQDSVECGYTLYKKQCAYRNYITLLSSKVFGKHKISTLLLSWGCCAEKDLES